MNNFDNAIDLLNVKDNLGYYFGKFVALIKNYPYYDFNNQEISLMLRELNIDSYVFNINDVKSILEQRDQMFTNQYIIGFLDSSPVMNYPYDIPYVDMKPSELDFLNEIFDDYQYPQNVLVYHQRYLTQKNNSFYYKKNPSAGHHGGLDPVKNGIGTPVENMFEMGNFYDLYAVERVEKIDDIEYMTTGLSFYLPSEYYFEIKPHPKLIEMGYIFVNNNIITDDQEVIIPLLNIKNEEQRIEDCILFPFPIARIILKKFYPTMEKCIV